VLLAGSSTVTIDAVGATLMGFDIERIPLIQKILDGNGQLPLYAGTREDIVVLDGDQKYSLKELGSTTTFISSPIRAGKLRGAEGRK